MEDMNKEPIYSLEMTYEEYCVWHESLDEYGKGLFSTPHDKELWNSVGNLKEHIEKLKEKLKNPGSSVGAMIAHYGIEQAKARLEYIEK
jgi:hypothetical protein